MKKTICIILILLLTINLFGCNRSSYNFEYKFKEEYSDKISPGIAATFIDMTKDVVKVYNTALKDFEVTDLEKEFSSYAGKVYMTYYENEDTLNEDEKELLEVILKQWDSVNTLYLLKQYHAKDEINKSMGIKTEYTDEHYKEDFQKKKGYIKQALEETKKFID